MIEVHGWMRCLPRMDDLGLLCEDRPMPIESFNSLIVIGFVTVWLMVGQFSFVKS